VRDTVFFTACMNFYPHFSHLLTDLRAISYTRSERDAVQHYTFTENQYSENHSRTHMKFCPYVLHFSSEFDTIRHRKSTKHIEGCVLLKGINKTTFTDWSQCRKHSATLFQHPCTWETLANIQCSMRGAVHRDVTKCVHCRAGRPAVYRMFSHNR
jgi:hypothetical protein